MVFCLGRGGGVLLGVEGRHEVGWRGRRRCGRFAEERKMGDLNAE